MSGVIQIRNAAIRRMLSRAAVLFSLLSIHALFGGGVAGAAGIEKLVMPGRVIEGHAEIEGECDACHDVQSDLAHAALCIECHDDVGDDREAKTGFHGKFDASLRNECVVCHTDHEGRDADIVPVDAGIFDHDYTDFPLLRAHLSTSCGDCHASDESYRDTPSSCGTCHSDDDIHGGALGDSCESCHMESVWAETSFNHSDTDYRLTGAHGSVECVDCHRGNRFAQTPRACNSCHAVDDIHDGSNGPACHDCHSTASWQNIGFDHFVETGFALEDGHGGLTCLDCHIRKDFKDGFDGSCVECHRTEDDHQGRNGTECQTCHQATDWPDTLFDHGETGFVLVDSHADLNCVACHKASVETTLPDDCGGCHAMDDSHNGQLGEDCGSCHQQTTWQASPAFDHDLSSFPLTGMHAPVPCAACHDSNRFHDATAACVGCHQDDDSHRGTLGTECADCHTSNDWSATVFNHDTQTEFPLDGAHADIECQSCHRDANANISDVPSNCGGCHRTDDAHDGQFGTQCGECHNSSTFSDIESL